MRSTIARVASSEQMIVACEDDVVHARREVRQLAQRLGFDQFTSAAITTATSELARNIWVHAARGTVLVEHLVAGAQDGIRAEFRDDGPGIVDLDRVLGGRVGTARSDGLGVADCRRLVDEFHIETSVGLGTVVVVVKWKPSA